MNIEKLSKGFFDKEIAKEVSLAKCQHCLSTNTVDLIVYQRYASNLGVPFYPTNKKVVAHCTHCKQQLKIEEMNTDQKEQAIELKARTKTPLHMWTGLIAIAILLCLLFASKATN